MKMNVADYIGLPWCAYATGPDAFDCHGIVWHGLHAYYGVDMSRYREVITDDHDGIHAAISAEKKTGNWVPLEQPQDGCVVLMGSRRRLHHIGLWVDVNGGRCLHSRPGAGVALDRLSQLRTFAGVIEFWIHRDLL